MILVVVGYAIAMGMLQLGMHYFLSDLRSTPPVNGYTVLRMAWIGLSCSIISLAAMFGVLAPIPSLLRFPIATIGAAIAWAAILSGIPSLLEASMSGGWAAMAGEQFLLVSLGTVMLQAAFLAQQGSTSKRFLGQYSLSMLLAWITLISVGCGLLRWACWAFGWDRKVLEWEWLLHLLLIGGFNAALALLALAGNWGSAMGPRRFLISLAFAAVLITLEPEIMWLCFRRVGAEPSGLWLMGGAQVVALFLSLHVIGRGGGLGTASSDSKKLLR